MNVLALSNGYYSAEISNFLKSSSEYILGVIATNNSFPIETTQRDAWIVEIQILKKALVGLNGTLLLEFSVPRIGSRLDAVIIAGSTIFAIEFKVGETEFNRADLNQVWDYALDLKNFHQGSHEAAILPILVATSANSSDETLPTPSNDRVFPPVRCNGSGLRKLIQLGTTEGVPLNAQDWDKSSYQPTPTIIEAAQALYANHSVESITRHGAGAKNLRLTSQKVEQLIEETRLQKTKSIIFVTGVPGAGKTLVGLNIATKKRNHSEPTHAVFLSGNGPLVQVLTEALTRDEVSRLKLRGTKTRKNVVGQKVKAFIQNVHHFRDAGLKDPTAPSDHVVIFDEAQRAWNLEMTANFMQRKKGRPGFTQSEPEFLISYLDRHTDWAVVICLVGGGQEINRGEAGISAWLNAMSSSFPHWVVHLSPDLTGDEYAADAALKGLTSKATVRMDDDLHLSVSMRSFRAEKLSAFVKAVLDCEHRQARDLFAQIAKRYPVMLTRDLEKAKAWIRLQARGSERFGLVASSEAQRLKPYAIDVRVNVDPVHWFLNDADDTRSSFYMEDAATEFQVQGLELDWVCMTWDADLRFNNGNWNHHSFIGSKWTNIHKQERQQYLVNAYRVLLTRARQGMVIFVPSGDSRDPTRAPPYYDSTFNYLSAIGIPELPA